MNVAVIGNGVIGGYISNQLKYWNDYDDNDDIIIDIFSKEEKDRLTKCKECFDMFILATRMENVSELPIVDTKTPVVTTIKGIYNNKKVSDYFSNLIVMSGYYTPTMFTPTFVYENNSDFELIKNIFPDSVTFRNIKANVKKAVMINYQKNMYLLALGVTSMYEIIRDIYSNPFINDDRLVNTLVEDILLCVREKSRNYIAGQELKVGRLVSSFYRLEGPMSFINSDDYKSNLLNDIRAKILSNIIGVEKFGTQTTLEF